MAAVVYIS